MTYLCGCRGTHRGIFWGIFVSRSLISSWMCPPFYNQQQLTINSSMQLILPEKVDISPEYLLTLSKQVDVLNKLALLDRRGPLTQQFSVVLQQQFKELGQLLGMYGDDQVMKDTAVLKCKSSLQFYVWEKANTLLSSVSEQLSDTMVYLAQQLQEQVQSLERVVHRQRLTRAEIIDAEKDKIIVNLRRDLGVKRDYIFDLEERVREVEDQNSKLYSKMITNAKNKVDYFVKSPAKGHHPYRSTSTDKNASPRKKILTRSIEDEINEILQSKWKIQSLNEGRVARVSLQEYLRTYFTMKYGKPMAEQQEAGFRDNVAYLAKQQEKHIFVLFQSVLDEQCQQSFIQEEKIFLDKVIRYIKIHLNEKYKRPHHELQKMFEGKFDQKNDFFLTEMDIETLLANIYRSGEVRTLQMILSELAASRSNEHSSKLSCKRLINQILEYELKKHLMRVEDIVREISRVSDKTDFLTLGHLQRIATRTIHDRQRLEIFLRDMHEERRWTVSEVIQLIERARHMRIRRQA